MLNSPPALPELICTFYQHNLCTVPMYKIMDWTEEKVNEPISEARKHPVIWESKNEKKIPKTPHSRKL